jgi:hypothetical protein
MSIPDHFRALIISEPKDGGRATGKLATISRDALPTQGEVLVQVFFSSPQFASAKADWLLPGLSLLTSMAFGTAGLTAMLSVLALELSQRRHDEGRFC